MSAAELLPPPEVAFDFPLPGGKHKAITLRAPTLADAEWEYEKEIALKAESDGLAPEEIMARDVPETIHNAGLRTNDSRRLLLVFLRLTDSRAIADALRENKEHLRGMPGAADIINKKQTDDDLAEFIADNYTIAAIGEMTAAKTRACLLSPAYHKEQVDNWSKCAHKFPNTVSGGIKR